MGKYNWSPELGSVVGAIIMDVSLGVFAQYCNGPHLVVAVVFGSR